MLPTAVALAYQLEKRWTGDMGAIEDDEWEEALDTCKKVSRKISDRLTQFYILRRFYLTPLRLAKFRDNYSPLCPRCGGSDGTFFHILWSCAVIQDYWSHIVRFIHDKMGSPLTLCPKQCLLGVFPNPDSNKYHHMLLQETLFTARLLIARKWLRVMPPTIREWVAAVNAVLPYKKETYAHRGSPAKYGKIWDTWLGEASTCDELDEHST